jgi:hypothetical protein
MQPLIIKGESISMGPKLRQTIEHCLIPNNVIKIDFTDVKQMRKLAESIQFIIIHVCTMMR